MLREQCPVTPSAMDTGSSAGAIARVFGCGGKFCGSTSHE